MKRILIASVLMLSLSGCLPTGTRSFPDIPDNLKVACPDLILVDPNTSKLSDVLNVVTDNYAQYQTCQVEVDGWLRWYNEQKTIFDSVK